MIDIFTLKNGDKVTVTEESLNNGYANDSALAKEYLEVGKEYEVDGIFIFDWNSVVFLKEFEGIGFNSANFEELT